MHELSLVANILEQTQRHAEGRQVKTITLSIGVLTCADPGAMHFCFTACREEAGLAATELVIQRQFAQGQCRRCGQQFIVTSAIQPCKCGSLDVDLQGGDDIVLTELEFA